MTSVRRWLTQSLARRITVLVSVLLLAVGAGILAVSFYQVVQVSEQIAADRLEQIAGQLTPLFARANTDRAAKLSRLANSPAIVAGLRARDTLPSSPAALALQQSVATERRVAIALFDSTGARLLEAGPPGQPSWFGDQPVRLNAALADSGLSIGPLVKLNDSTLLYDAVVPVREGSSTLGVVLHRGTMTMSPENRATFGWLLGASTSVVLGDPSVDVWTDLGGLAPAPPPEALTAGAVKQFAWGGIEYIGITQSIPRTPWLLIVRAPRATVRMAATKYLSRAAALTVVLVGLGALVAAAIGRRLSRPIEEITEVTESIAEGDYSSRANEAAPGEVGRLGASFNAMVQRVADSTSQVRQSEERLRGFVTRSGEGIWRLEFPDGLDTSLPPERQLDACYRAELECNQTLARMLGVEVADGMARFPLERVFPRGDPAAARVLQNFARNGYRVEGAETRAALDGTGMRLFVDDLIGTVEQGRLRRIWGTRRDITLERMVDERLSQSQRLESIGRLAGGVAHDFNNLLTVMLGYAESLKERLPDGQGRRDADEIRRTALRAAELSRQLLAFSRGQVLRPTVLDLNATLRAMEPILRKVLGEDIDLQLKLAEWLDPIEADPGQIERVVMNLVVNGRDAMPEGGTLELRTAVFELHESDIRSHPTLTPGRYMLLVISDTGTGMGDEVKRHAFEPFYSTKDKGKGHGLGLATVYGIVRQSQGGITLYSELGHGTEFKVLLPAKVGAATIEVAGPAAESSGKARGETILLVEDEPAVLEMAKVALTEAGYNVLAAPDGHAALRISAEHPGAIDLILTDMVMPGMSGRDLVKTLRRSRPTIRVIISSGYSGETHPALSTMSPTEGYLEKPFLISKLRKSVREMLDTSRSDGAGS